MEGFSFFPAVVASLSVSLVAALLAMVYFWRRSIAVEEAIVVQRAEFEEKLERSVRSAVEVEAERAREALKQAEQRHSQSLEDQKSSALSVVVHPFVNTEAQKGIFSKETKIEVGYKYQLFVQGLPCFEPHTMVLESTVQKEVDQQALDYFKAKAEQAAEAAVLVKGGGVAKTAITIAKTVFKLAR